MKRRSACIVVLLACAQVRGQTVTPEVVSSAGNHASSAGGMIQWTIGEPVVATYATSSNLTTMGFHQPVTEAINGIHEAGKGKLVAYPNPVTQMLGLDFGDLADGTYDVTITDEAGRLVFSSQIKAGAKNRLHNLEVSGIASGAYILRLQSSTNTATFKFTKVSQ